MLEVSTDVIRKNEKRWKLTDFKVQIGRNGISYIELPTIARLKQLGFLKVTQHSA